MKLSKLILAGILAAGFASVANAQTYVRFTGSTAFRTQAIQAIQAALSPGYKCAYNGTSLTGANDQIFSGSVSGTSVIIKAHWNGSEAGIQLVAQDASGLATGYLPDSSIPVSGTASVTDALSDVSIPDVTFSDTFQATSQFNSSASIIISGTAHTYASLVGANGYSGGVVGIVPFKWIASNGGKLGSSGTITNMTSQLARSLFTVSKVGSGGSLPLSLFTALTSDTSVNVYPVGRNPDSGTRLTEFAETGLGALKVVTQYQPVQSGTTAVVTGTTQTMGSIQLWPVDTVNGISIVKANSGYASGGQLGAALALDTSSITTPQGTGGILVGFLSTGDAAVGIAGLARELSFNGVFYSTTAVTTGQYTAWSYEHIYYRSGSSVSGIADTIAQQVHDNTAPVKTSQMLVGRLTDGAAVTYGNSY